VPGPSLPGPSYLIHPSAWKVELSELRAEGILRSRRKSCDKRFLRASGDTYADVPRLLARHRDGGPGIHRAWVVASRARSAFSGSRRGDGDTGVSGVSLTGRSFFWFEVRWRRHARIGGGAGHRRFSRRPPVLGIRWFDACITIPLRGRAGHLIPPSEERRPGLLRAFIHRSA
jgi:hypothetical protein